MSTFAGQERGLEFPVREHARARSQPDPCGGGRAGPGVRLPWIGAGLEVNPRGRDDVGVPSSGGVEQYGRELGERAAVVVEHQQPGRPREAATPVFRAAWEPRRSG